MSQSELARRVAVDRVTVYRWENGIQRPENVDVVKRVAEALGVEVDEALAAAGLRLDADPPARPTREPPMPPELLELVRRLADPNTPQRDKDFIHRTLVTLANLPAEEQPPRRRRTGS